MTLSTESGPVHAATRGPVGSTHQSTVSSLKLPLTFEKGLCVFILHGAPLIRWPDLLGVTTRPVLAAVRGLQRGVAVPLWSALGPSPRDLYKLGRGGWENTASEDEPTGAVFVLPARGDLGLTRWCSPVPKACGEEKGACVCPAAPKGQFGSAQGRRSERERVGQEWNSWLAFKPRLCLRGWGGGGVAGEESRLWLPIASPLPRSVILGQSHS